MKPLAIFAGVVVVGLALIAGGLRLTGSSAGANPSATPMITPLTRTQFVHAADRVCGQELREAKARGLRHPKITSLRSLTRYFRLAVPLFDAEAAGVRVLIPPRSEAAAFRRLTTNLALSEGNANSILHALQTRQIRRAFLFAKRQDVLDKRMNTESRKLGLTVCARS